ncbi:MAG TPA: DMT family transporter [Candidatus Obscuribacter sp.]|nr:DMT family transporter [Candidatus Obscuribacter sp.]MBK9280974.1 DMT family transporter [Candidatus Obscuribacter sp.]MBL8084689.1 DMT family transporter [Candidatus Obscuribacter sp.]HMW88824.1 DMT family transporter [Candidatus Obscuribacter sp.]HMX45292.1 DMT family transporter [Candidatus Obscuribacter sp.]
MFLTVKLGIQCHNWLMETSAEPENSLKQAEQGSPTTSVHTAVRLALASSAIFSLMFALIKLLGKAYPAGEILFCRSFFALIPLLPAIIANGGLKVFQTQKPLMHLTRSTMGLVSAFLCIEALKLLPLSEATSFFYSAPLITTVFSIFLLKETISFKKLAAVMLGFGGVLYMLQPHVNHSLSGALIALGSALGAGFVAIELRRMSETEKSITIVSYFMTACTLVGLLTMPFQFTMPGPTDAAILIGIGITGGIAQIFMTEAYKHAPASTVAPLNYSSLIWASGFDALIFAKIPTLTTVLGALLVTASGIFVIKADRPPPLETRQPEPTD